MHLHWRESGGGIGSALAVAITRRGRLGTGADGRGRAFSLGEGQCNTCSLPCPESQSQPVGSSKAPSLPMSAVTLKIPVPSTTQGLEEAGCRMTGRQLTLWPRDLLRASAVDLRTRCSAH